MRKKLLSMIFAVFMVASLTACAGDATSTTSGADISGERQEEQPVEEPAVTDSGAVDDYDVKIGECAFGEDYEGNKMIVVNYDFTNNSDEAIAPFIAVTMKAFQDGVELEMAIAMDDSVYDAGIGQKEIKPGASITGCQNAYILSSDSPVEVEVGPMFGDAVLFKTFNVQ